MIRMHLTNPPYLTTMTNLLEAPRTVAPLAAVSSAASDVDYRYGADFTLDEMRELYVSSTLGARRPVDDPDILGNMLRHANLVVTAWEGPLLVGVARTLTDFSYVGYLADLAVRTSHQRRGIGTELIRRTRACMGPRSSLVLLSAPAAADYYPRIGFSRHASAWVVAADDPIGSPRTDSAG